MEPDTINGNCICVHCDAKLVHEKGRPCKETLCPNCGKRMIREGGYHHELYLQKNKTKR